MNNNINEIYVINLKKRPERLELFKKNYKLIHDYKIIDAIDGNELIHDKEYIDTIVGTQAKKTLHDFYKYNIIRKYHYELSSYGAIGCYLTHINIWNEIIKSNKQNALIFEDDAKVSNIYYFDLNKRLKLLPNDWDIYLLINPDFCYLKKPVKNNRNLFKVKRFFLLHAYIININACKKIIEKTIKQPRHYQTNIINNVVEQFQICDISRSRDTGEFSYSNQNSEWMPESCLFDTNVAARNERSRLLRMIKKWIDATHE
jgi:GR25 family glycosyltransferase involved in LPS biosynthesis